MIFCIPSLDNIIIFKLNRYIVGQWHDNNKSAIALILIMVTLLLLLVIPEYVSNRNILVKDWISLSSFPSALAFQKSMHYYSGISHATLHNNVISSRSMTFTTYSANNYDTSNNYVSRMISFNAVDNGGNYTNNCNKGNIDANSKTKPITPHVLPPKIVMMYNGKEYDVGNLINSKYREGITLSQLQIPPEKINTLLPNVSTTIVKGSCLGFVIKNDPLALPPSSISANAYNIQGKAVNVLSTIEHSKSTFFNINLNQGKYILLVVATWLPGSEKVTGYEEYIYLINIVDGK